MPELQEPFVDFTNKPFASGEVPVELKMATKFISNQKNPTTKAADYLFSTIIL